MAKPAEGGPIKKERLYGFYSAQAPFQLQETPVGEYSPVESTDPLVKTIQTATGWSKRRIESMSTRNFIRTLSSSVENLSPLSASLLVYVHRNYQGIQLTDPAFQTYSRKELVKAAVRHKEYFLGDQSKNLTVLARRMYEYSAEGFDAILQSEPPIDEEKVREYDELMRDAMGEIFGPPGIVYFDTTSAFVGFAAQDAGIVRYGSPSNQVNKLVALAVRAAHEMQVGQDTHPYLDLFNTPNF